MKVVVAKYSFQGTPGLSQLSFPMGASIQATSRSRQGGWMFGSYAGHSGWFPESYVDVPVVAVVPQQQAQSHHLSYSNAMAEQNDLPSSFPSTIYSSYTANSTSTTVTPAAHQAVRVVEPASVENEEAFPMMGGTPGSLFEDSTAHFTMYDNNDTTTKDPDDRPSFLQQDEQDEPEEPVDIYRQAPPRKRNYAQDYTPEISVQITSSSAPTTPTPRTLLVASPSPTSATDFWKAHPGRVPGNTSAEQATKLDRQSRHAQQRIDNVFEGLKDTETIAILDDKSKKKKKKHFPFLPKSIQRAAQRTANAVHVGGHNKNK